MQLRQKKRGRPRQNRPVIDHGTQELQDKRSKLLSDASITNPALAESLLGIFYGKQLISSSLYKAGVCFGELAYRYEPCAGYKSRQYSSTLLAKLGNEGYGNAPGVWSDECHVRRTVAWRKAVLALQQAGNEPYRTVMSVVFYDQDLYLTPFSKRMINLVQPLRTGLKFLEAYFIGELPIGRDTPRGRVQNLERSTIFQVVSKELPPDYRALYHGKAHHLPLREI